MPSNTPRLTVVIPTCAGERWLPSCLESLRAQTVQNFEAVVVANGCEDRTVEILRQDFPWVRIVEMEGRQGFSRPVNAGWRAAVGEWVFVLNDDTMCDPDCLESLLADAGEHPEADFFAAMMVYFDDPAIINSAGHSLTAEGTVLDRGEGQPASGYWGQARDVVSACAGAAMYRRTLLEELDGFDEDFWAVHEDADIGLRASLRGHKGRLSPGAVVRHRQSQTLGPRSARIMHLYFRSHACLLLKDFPPGFWARYRRPALSHLLRAGFQAVRQGYAGALLRARWDLIFLGPRMLRKRRDQLGLLIEKGDLVTGWVGADQPPASEAAMGAPGKSPGRKIAKALLPTTVLALVVAVALWVPMLLWLGVAAAEDRCGARKLARARRG